jgi:hypothetical protein
MTVKEMLGQKGRTNAMTDLRFGIAVALISLSTLIASTAAYAVPITYTQTATASGSLNSVIFTNASIVLTENSDTTNVTNPSAGIFHNIGTLSLSITGFAPVTFTDSTVAVVNQSGPAVGFSDLTLDLAILATVSNSFSAYDLTSSIGPITGISAANLNTNFATSGGIFFLTSVGDSTFTATTTAVPEPSSLAILFSTLVGLGFLPWTCGRRTVA